jgi:hypothetical protein
VNRPVQLQKVFSQDIFSLRQATAANSFSTRTLIHPPSAKSFSYPSEQRTCCAAWFGVELGLWAKRYQYGSGGVGFDDVFGGVAMVVGFAEKIAQWAVDLGGVLAVLDGSADQGGGVDGLGWSGRS